MPNLVDNSELDEISKQRNQLVVKHNKLIQETRFDLTLQQQKIVLYLISKIKPEDKIFHEYEFDISEFCEICGIEQRSGGNYKAIKATLTELHGKSRWIEFDEDTEALTSWILSPKIRKKSGRIKLFLDPNLAPYLLDLQKNFTSYYLLYVLAMKSQYSIRLYEILRSYEYKPQPVRFDIEELRQVLKAEHYERFPDFRRRVLDVAMREIKEYADLSVTYTPVKYKSRSYNKIDFDIQLIKDYKELAETWGRINEIIDPAQMTLF